MTALRQLSVVYVAAAGAYAVALTMSAHPDLTRTAEETAVFLKSQTYRTAVVLDQDVLKTGWRLAEAAGRSIGQRIVEQLNPPSRVRTAAAAKTRTASTATEHARNMAVASRLAPLRSVPENRKTELPPSEGASGASENAPPPPTLRGPVLPLTHAAESATPVPPRPSLALAPPASPPAAPPTTTASLPPTAPAGAADVIRVTERLKESLTSELYANFELFLYISKAAAGPWAQHMYVFQKQANGDLNLLYNWPVSTGREQIEFNPEGRRLRTVTPQGYYELDSHRSYEHYRSAEWGQPMPYAMFFNWIKDGNQSGLAIHAASGDDVARLGQRASAGCIHLSEDNARTLFTMIRSEYRGLAPRFAIDRRTGTMSNGGILLHDPQGTVKMAEGYKVLVFIEDYGGENVVAALF